MSVTSAKKLKNPQTENLVVAILAATRQARMGNYGTKSNIVLPNNQTLLQHQLEFVHKHWNPTEIFVSVGYDADRVINKRPSHTRLIENNRWEETGEVEELRLILNCCNPDRLVIMCGDLFLNSLGLSLGNESWSLSLNNPGDLNQIGVKSEDGSLSLFSFSFDYKFLGLAQLVGNELNLLRKLITRERGKFALWELFEEYVKHGYKLKGVELNTKKIIKLCTSKDLSVIRNSFGLL